MTASDSLRRRAIDLAALGAFACVFAWCVQQAGADNLALHVVSGIMAVVSVVVVFAATRREFRWLGIPAPLIMGALAIAPIGSLALKIDAALLLVVAVVGTFWPLGVRALAALVMLAAAASLVASVVPGWRELPKLVAIRGQIQVESLEPRLGYERKRFPNLDAPGPTLSDQVAKNLELAELTCCWDREPRHYVVEGMLDRQLELWVRGSGLADPHLTNYLSGYAKFPKPSLRKVSFREQAAPESDSADATRPFICPAYNATPTERLHIAHRDDFLAPTYYGGLVEPLERVADFVPHGIYIVRRPATSN